MSDLFQHIEYIVLVNILWVNDSYEDDEACHFMSKHWTKLFVVV